jgi:hypothetical protein
VTPDGLHIAYQTSGRGPDLIPLLTGHGAIEAEWTWVPSGGPSFGALLFAFSR